MVVERTERGDRMFLTMLDRNCAQVLDTDALAAQHRDRLLAVRSHHIGDGMPIYGVRSSDSSVGYLCCAGPEDPEALVQTLLAKRFAVGGGSSGLLGRAVADDAADDDHRRPA